MKKLKDFITNFCVHNPGIVIGQVICMLVMLWIYGCESQVHSITTPNVKVTRGELQVEVDSFFALADLRFQQLDQQDELKKTIFEHALLWSSTGTINPVGLMTALAAIMGIGATVDNVTKRRTERKKMIEYIDHNAKKE